MVTVFLHLLRNIDNVSTFVCLSSISAARTWTKTSLQITLHCNGILRLRCDSQTKSREIIDAITWIAPPRQRPFDAEQHCHPSFPKNAYKVNNPNHIHQHNVARSWLQLKPTFRNIRLMKISPQQTYETFPLDRGNRESLCLNRRKSHEYTQSTGYSSGEQINAVEAVCKNKLWVESHHSEVFRLTGMLRKWHKVRLQPFNFEFVLRLAKI